MRAIFQNRNNWALGIALTAFLTTGPVLASGVALKEQSGSKLGNAFAGAGSEANDPSVMFFNPAGMTRLEGNQASAVFNLILPTIDFTDTGSNRAGNDGGHADVPIATPAGYVVYDVSPNYRFGLSLNVPFGLTTDYKNNFVGRFQAIESELQVLSFGPTMASKLTDSLSFGAGVYIEQLDVRLTQATPLSAFGAFTDGQAILEGDATTTAFTTGFLYEMDEATRFGLTYRSSQGYDINGLARFINPTGAPAGPFVNTNFSTNHVTLPESVLFSVYHDIDDRWAVMGDIEWTRWSSLQSITIDFVNAAQPNQLLLFNWENTYFYSLGANYKWNDKWLLRTGVAYDESPTNTSALGPRVPDSDRTWVALGATYKGMENFTVDFGYAHLFMDNAPINKDNENGSDIVRGLYDNAIELLSVQGTLAF